MIILGDFTGNLRKTLLDSTNKGKSHYSNGSFEVFTVAGKTKKRFVIILTLHSTTRKGAGAILWETSDYAIVTGHETWLSHVYNTPYYQVRYYNKVTQSYEYT